MRTLSVRGIEIIDDPSVPDGEIWLMCPMSTGGKVRYMFNLLDHRMTQPADKSFFFQLEEWIKLMKTNLERPGALRDDTLTEINLILQAMREFQIGEDPRTIPADAKD